MWGCIRNHERYNTNMAKPKRIDPLEQKVQLAVYIPTRYKMALHEYVADHPDVTLSHFMEVAIRRELKHRAEQEKVQLIDPEEITL